MSGIQIIYFIILAAIFAEEQFNPILQTITWGLNLIVHLNSASPSSFLWISIFVWPCLYKIPRITLNYWDFSWSLYLPWFTYLKPHDWTRLANHQFLTSWLNMLNPFGTWPLTTGPLKGSPALYSIFYLLINSVC